MYGSIYKITCTVTNKIYIGKTTQSIEQRLKEHCKTSKFHRSYTSYLYNAMNKYGTENFTVEQIEICNSEEELDNREKFWIKELQSQNPSIGYNIQEGGEGGSVRSDSWKPSQKQLDALEYGRHLPSSEKHKAQLSERRTGILVSEDTKQKLREARKHQVTTQETRQKMSLSHLGMKMPERSEESKEKYKSASSDRIHIHKGTNNKNPKRSEVQKYLDDGWEIGYYYSK